MKYHVGIFIKEYLELLNMTKYKLAQSSNISKTKINEIIAGKSNLSPEIAIKIAPFLNVSPQFLLNLHLLWIKYKNVSNFLESHKKVTKNIKLLNEDIYNLNLSKERFDVFNKKPKTFLDNSGFLYYYEPKKSNLIKNYILVEYLNSINTIDATFDIKNFQNYIFNEYVKLISKIVSYETYKNSIYKIRSSLEAMGIYLIIENTGLNTTIKGMTRKITNNFTVFVEENDDISKEIWYLTHELAHILIPNEKNEENINNLAKKILLKEFFGLVPSITINTIWKEKYKLKELNINPFVFISIKGYQIKNFKPTKKYILTKGGKNDNFYS